MKIRLLLLSGFAAVATVMPAAPAAATHACGDPFQIVCDAQHIVLDKIDFLVRCKVLHQC